MADASRTEFSPKLSVIIPTYNRKVLVTQAIDSILSQPDPIGTAVLVADDGSSDGTIPHLKQRFEGEIATGRLRLLELAHSGDPAATRNQGARASQTEFVGFLDSDDHWLPGRLSELAPFLEHSDLILSVAPNEDELAQIAANYPKLTEVDWLREYVRINLGNTSSAVMRRNLFFEAGGFPENYFGDRKLPKPLRGFEDYELWLRILCRLRSSGRSSRFKPLSAAQIVIQPQAGSVGSLQLRDQMLREAITVAKVLPLLPKTLLPQAARRIAGALKAAAGL